MRVRSLRFALVALICVQCSRPETTMTIKVKGARDQIPAVAHVHLAKLEDPVSNPIWSQKFDHDGRFSFELPDGGPYHLWITAVNHMPVRVPLLGEIDSDVSVEVRLAGYDHVEEFEDVRIHGDWNPFGGSQEMERQTDGTFVLEKEIEKELVAYQLSGIVKDKRIEVNGAAADSFRYDGKGHYRSLITVKNMKLRIVFDPSKLSSATNNRLPSVKFDGKHGELAKLSEITQRFDCRAQDYFNDYFAYEKKHGGITGFHLDLNDIKVFLLGEMDKGATPLIRRLAALYLPQLAFYSNIIEGASGQGVHMESKLYAEIAKLVPPESPLWALDSVEPLPESVAYGLSDPDADNFLQQLFSRNRNRKVKAVTLLAQIKLASKRRDEVRQEELYQILASDYREIMKASQYLHMEFIKFDPNNPLAPGRPVPNFEVELIDEGKKVSKASLTGKYYLLDFWATWCTPCIAEMPNLHAAYKKYRDHNFAILSLSLDNSVADIRKFRTAKWPMPWMHTILEGGSSGSANSEIGRAFRDGGRLWSIPRPILVSPDGTILATHFALTRERLEKTLKKYLGQKTNPP